jgi:hypothetical protein
MFLSHAFRPLWVVLCSVSFACAAEPVPSSSVALPIGVSHPVSRSPQPAFIASQVSSPDGSDADVAAFDAFSVDAPGQLVALDWQGQPLSSGLQGFVISVYASSPAQQPDLRAPLSVSFVPPPANAQLLAPGLSSFQARLAQPLPVRAHVRYWLSIVAQHAPGSLPWGWAASTGSGPSLQLFSELRWLPAPASRAFQWYGLP